MQGPREKEYRGGWNASNDAGVTAGSGILAPKRVSRIDVEHY